MKSKSLYIYFFFLFFAGFFCRKVRKILIFDQKNKEIIFFPEYEIVQSGVQYIDMYLVNPLNGVGTKTTYCTVNVLISM